MLIKKNFVSRKKCIFAKYKIFQYGKSNKNSILCH